MHRDDARLFTRLQQLATATLAIGFAGAIGASRLLPPSTGGEPLHDTRRLLEQIRREAGTARASAEGSCAIPAVPAVAFLDMGRGFNYSSGGQGAVTFELTGNNGIQQFTFLSGISFFNIMTALNSFAVAVGVQAKLGPELGDRIELSSIDANADGFVRVHILDGPAILYAESVGGEPLGDYKDYGANAITLSTTLPSVP